MRTIKSYRDLQRIISENESLLVYLTAPDCSVCHADMPRVERLVEEMDFPSVQIDIAEVPEAAGQLTVFTAPVTLLFYRGRAYHREARMIDFNMLKKRMLELKG